MKPDGPGASQGKGQVLLHLWQKTAFTNRMTSSAGMNGFWKAGNCSVVIEGGVLEGQALEWASSQTQLTLISHRGLQR